MLSLVNPMDFPMFLGHVCLAAMRRGERGGNGGQERLGQILAECFFVGAARFRLGWNQKGNRHPMVARFVCLGVVSEAANIMKGFVGASRRGRRKLGTPSGSIRWRHDGRGSGVGFGEVCHPRASPPLGRCDVGTRALHPQTRAAVCGSDSGNWKIVEGGDKAATNRCACGRFLFSWCIHIPRARLVEHPKTFGISGWSFVSLKRRSSVPLKLDEVNWKIEMFHNTFIIFASVPTTIVGLKPDARIPRRRR